MSVFEFDGLGVKINRWAMETFGDHRDDPASLGRVLAHLRREVDELCAHPEDPQEAADVGILLLRVAGLQGFSLVGAVLDKFEVLKKREWGEPDHEGVRSHVRDGGELAG